MDLYERIAAFVKLGQYIENLDDTMLSELTIKARSNNSWFTPENVTTALKGLTRYLREDALKQWTDAYDIKDQHKRIGIVMAGNIPLVGFHDLLSVLISGHQAHVKLSSQDTALMMFVIEALQDIDKGFEELIVIKERLKDIDAIIATGSDNTSRYFEYYFSKHPNIIRKNRSSCAILTGKESREDLESLGNDIFLYYGLGCRNVAKLYVPKDYNFATFYESLEGYKDITHHHKYANNYDYNKSIYLVNGAPHLDNGFLMLRQEKGMVSPVSVVYYEEYTDESELKDMLNSQSEKIQCIVSNEQWPGSKALGEAQTPELWDYADNVDTMKFLTEL